MEQQRICVICNHVHDEELEGKWDELLDTFECPECGAFKEDYQLL
jgi:hypothetical protein